VKPRLLPRIKPIQSRCDLLWKMSFGLSLAQSIDLANRISKLSLNGRLVAWKGLGIGYLEFIN